MWTWLILYDCQWNNLSLQQKPSGSCPPADCSRRTLPRALARSGWGIEEWLNPIEKPWCLVKRSIAGLPVAKSVGELEIQVQEEWQKVLLEAIQSLVDSMLQQIAEAIGAKGGHTHY